MFFTLLLIILLIGVNNARLAAQQILYLITKCLCKGRINPFNHAIRPRQHNRIGYALGNRMITCFTAQLLSALTLDFYAVANVRGHFVEQANFPFPEKINRVGIDIQHTKYFTITDQRKRG